MKDLMHIQIDARELAKGLRDLSLAGQDMTPLMRALAETLKTETDLNFEDEGHPAWQPSVAALAREGMTLSASGQLRGSVTTDYSSHHATAGSNLDYARIHQLGGKAGRQRRVTLPARPYLPVDEQGALQPGIEQKLLESVLRLSGKGHPPLTPVVRFTAFRRVSLPLNALTAFINLYKGFPAPFLSPALTVVAF